MTGGKEPQQLRDPFTSFRMTEEVLNKLTVILSEAKNLSLNNETLSQGRAFQTASRKGVIR